MSSIYGELETEWNERWNRAERETADWFARHARHARHATAADLPGDIITTDPPPATPPQETTMSVPDAVAALKANLQTAEAALNDALTQDVPGLENIGTQIDNSRLIQAAVAADAVVPPAVLDAEAATLEALAAAFAPAAPAAGVGDQSAA